MLQLGESLQKVSGVSAGLCVQLGCEQLDLAADLARSGRMLVQVFTLDPTSVDAARLVLDSQGLYGLAAVDRLASMDSLPLAENLVNLLVVEESHAAKAAIDELVRVVRPLGVICVAPGAITPAALEAAGLENVRELTAGCPWLVGRKPWPATMDQWQHSRHSADGNAVSRDRQVGPPRRVRWVAGPLEEISNMVTSEGYNYYAGILVRDGFNGLRLWQRAIEPSPARGGYVFPIRRDSVVPVAVGRRLLVVSHGALQALDGADGHVLREYPEAKTPNAVLVEGRTVLAFDAHAVRALDLDDGRLIWRREATAPRYAVAGDGAVCFIHGNPNRGQPCVVTRLALDSGKVAWQQNDFAWASKIRGVVYHDGLLAFEISTFNNDGPGNQILVASANDGAVLWSHDFVPGMTHYKQARALFIGRQLWVLAAGGSCLAFDARTGSQQKTYQAGSGHCYPPVATDRYLFAGEMDLTDLSTGQVDANRITKGACGRDAGVVPANGLTYVFPKHCVCWPMLRGYAALAPALAEEKSSESPTNSANFVVERGVDPPEGDAPSSATDWSCYRHDAWRSGSTTAEVSASLDVAWTTRLGSWPQGPIAEDWRHNPFIHGPISAPVVVGATVYVARTDACQIVALDLNTGRPRWRFTANGRIDTAPTIHAGLCLFGSKSGWLYCLRADDGRLVWRMRVAPGRQRIVAHGQVESPWPVPGSVLVVDGRAYAAAGRQALADGGIVVVSFDPATGKLHWVERIDSLPFTQYYNGGSALEFDDFDLMHREGDSVVMSRWFFDRQTGRQTVDAKSGFARLTTGGSGVMVPRGAWSYASRYVPELVNSAVFRRPLVVFRDNRLLGVTEDKQSVYRRDFNLGDGETFDAQWYSKGASYAAFRSGGIAWRSQRLAQGAAWSAPVFEAPTKPGQVAALVAAGETLFVAGVDGGLTALSVTDGRCLARRELPPPVWDGMAATTGRLLVSTLEGDVICLTPSSN